MRTHSAVITWSGEATSASAAPSSSARARSRSGATPARVSTSRSTIGRVYQPRCASLAMAGPALARARAPAYTGEHGLPPDNIGIATDVYDELSLAEALDRLAVHTTLAEIYSGDRHDLLDAGNRRAAIASGMRITVHGPFEDLLPGSLHERERRHAVDAHRRHLEAAAEIGALCYAVHPDVRERPGPPDPRVLAALGRTIEELADLQREYGVRVVLENCRVPGSRTSSRPATWTSESSASSWTRATPPSPASCTTS